MTNSPFDPTKLRVDVPLYPPPLQLLRITGGTVSGPSGYASSSVLGPSVHIGYTQQLHPTTLIPRDREPCFAIDVNRYGLSPGYYLGRLSGNYQSLPLYEIAGAAVSPGSVLNQFSGLTVQQFQSLSSLTPAQWAVLNNLTPCQLQTLLTAVPISQIHTLTLTLTPPQLTALITTMTVTETTALITQLTTSQIIRLTTVLKQEDISLLVQVLTPPQIATLLTTYTDTQLRLIVTLPPATIERLFTDLPTATITNVFNNLTEVQIQKLFTLTEPEMIALILTLTIPQIKLFLDVVPMRPMVPPGVNIQIGTTYIVLPDDLGKTITISNGSPVAVTLPSAAIVGPGWTTAVFNGGVGTATLTPSSGTVNGAGSIALTTNQGAILVSDGVNWKAMTTGGSSGVVTFSGSRVYHNTTQTIATGANILTFNSERFDTAAYHDAGSPTLLTAPVTGYYRIGGYVVGNITDPPGSTTMSLSIRLNGATTLAANGFDMSAPDLINPSGLTVNTLYHLTAGDDLELIFTFAGSGSPDISTAEFWIEFAGT